MSVGEVLSQTGNGIGPESAILLGGIMMGTLGNPEMPITKTTTAIVILPAEHPRFIEFRTSLTHMRNQAISACCQCHSCEQICPRNLLGHPISPNRNMRSLMGGFSLAVSANLCSECGLCSGLITCPMGISPRRIHQQIKRAMNAAGTKPATPWTLGPEHPLRSSRRLSSHRLKDRLDISRYDCEPARFDGRLEPTCLKIALKQHIGISSRAVVKPGDSVDRSDMIGSVPRDAVGALNPSSRKGIVESVDESCVTIGPSPKSTPHRKK
jgi:Na+-translocating ferredoxin:NAD+ oxidoreductase RnfC subunit